MSGLFKQKQQTQKTTTTQSAPSYAVPGLTLAANDATSLYKSGAGYDQFAGSTVAPWSSQTQAGVNQLTSNAQQPDQLYGATNQGLTGLAQSGGLNAGQSDALGKMQSLYDGDGSFENALNASNTRIADQVNRQFAGLGGYGGTDYAKALGDQLSNNSSQFLFQNQQNKANLANSLFTGNQTGVSNLNSIGGLLPSMQSARDNNANQLLGAGSLVDTHNQNLLDDQIAKWDFNQSKGRQRISDYTGLLNGVVGNQGSTTASTSSPKASTLQQILGGGLGLLGLL